MTMIDTGTYGAKRQSTRKASPRDILVRLMERYPKATEQDLRQKFSQKVVDDQDQIDAIIEYWFANNYRSLAMQRTRETKPAAQKQQEATQRAAKIEEVKTIIKARATQMALLNLEVIVGKNKKKALRDCTGAECIKAGGWIVSVGKSIKATDVVGAVLNETQVRKMWNAA